MINMAFSVDLLGGYAKYVETFDTLLNSQWFDMLNIYLHVLSPIFLISPFASPSCIMPRVQQRDIGFAAIFLYLNLFNEENEG